MKSVGAWKAGQVFSHHPEHELEPGNWSWRVRPKNSKGMGPWSEVGKFNLLADRPAKPMPYRPGPERPLIMIEGGPDKWQHIPDDLKPYVWLKMRGFRSYDRTTALSDLFVSLHGQIHEAPGQLDDFSRQPPCGGNLR